MVGQLTKAQRKELIDKPTKQTAASESVELLESAGSRHKRCPHCSGERIVRTGNADGLQRYKCRGCGQTVNALTGSALSRLRHKSKWLDQVTNGDEGLPVE